MSLNRRLAGATEQTPDLAIVTILSQVNTGTLVSVTTFISKEQNDYSPVSLRAGILPVRRLTTDLYHPLVVTGKLCPARKAEPLLLIQLSLDDVSERRAPATSFQSFRE